VCAGDQRKGPELKSIWGAQKSAKVLGLKEEKGAHLSINTSPRTAEGGPKDSGGKILPARISPKEAPARKSRKKLRGVLRAKKGRALDANWTTKQKFDLGSVDGGN